MVKSDTLTVEIHGARSIVTLLLGIEGILNRCIKKCAINKKLLDDLTEIKRILKEAKLNKQC